jgi:GNAT superfamily N-acetyltransferase
MQQQELSELAITRVETDVDLEEMIHVWGVITPDEEPALENLRFNLEARDRAYLLARLDGEPVGRAFVEPWTDVAWGDVAVVPELRRRGIGSALLADISRRVRESGKDTIQGEARESDSESRGFLERRGYVQVGAEKALVLELDGLDPPAVVPPEGVRIVSRVEEPDRLEEMYAIATQGSEDIPGESGGQTFEQWREHEIDKPNRRPEFSFLALAGDEVVGYAALQVSRKRAFHGLTVTRRDWRRRGVATALKCAEIAAAKEAGFERLFTESEERNDPMRLLNEKLGYVPKPEWSMVVMRGPA